jgi:hypothetical protein
MESLRSPHSWALCTNMKATLADKHQIAIEYIETAIKLFDENKYYSSLHLSGAADQIFHDTLLDREVEPTKTTDARLAKKLESLYQGDHPSRESIEKVMDHSKNAIKHVKRGDGYIYEVYMRPNMDAFRMIRRAIKNARLCDINLGSEVNSFMACNGLELHNA